MKERATSQQAAKASFFGNFGRGTSNPLDERNAALAIVSMQANDNVCAGEWTHSLAVTIREADVVVVG